MTLARALTKRLKGADSAARLESVRHQISSPIALVSTTNMLSYNAPDIADVLRDRDTAPFAPFDQSSPSSTPSTPTRRSSSGFESDASTPSEASTTATSVHSSPMSDEKLSPNYFPKLFAPAQTDEALSTDDTYLAPADPAPQLPQRAPSHSKREHERLARKRSLQFSRPSSTQSAGDSKARNSLDAARSSVSSLPSITAQASPFSAELEQLSEVAEEFGAAARDVAAKDDRDVMETRGLAKFTADDYLMEIEPLWEMLWDEKRPSNTSEDWI